MLGLSTGLTLLVLAIGLFSLSSPNQAAGSSYYDGDGDDVGIASERVTGVSPVAVVQVFRPFAAPPLSVRPPAQRDAPVVPWAPLPARLVPRAPPSA